MNSRSPAISAVVLVVFVGAARAEINELPLPPAQPPDTIMQPAPESPSAPAISRRVQPRRRTESISLAHPYCAEWFACAQYRIVGIGF
jgi:hypothetical protein